MPINFPTDNIFCFRLSIIWTPLQNSILMPFMCLNKCACHKHKIDKLLKVFGEIFEQIKLVTFILANMNEALILFM